MTPIHWRAERGSIKPSPTGGTISARQTDTGVLHTLSLEDRARLAGEAVIFGREEDVRGGRKREREPRKADRELKGVQICGREGWRNTTQPQVEGGTCRCG